MTQKKSVSMADRKYLTGWQARDKLVFLYRSGDSLLKDVFPARAVSYHRPQELSDDAARIFACCLASDDVVDHSVEGDWTRVTWKNGGEYVDGKFRSIREREVRRLEAYGVPSWEADVSPLKRHMSDNDVHVGRPRRVYLDLETDSRVRFADAVRGQAKILVWCLVDATGTRLSGCLKADTLEAERELLQAFWEALEPYDQVCAWNGDGFDFPVLRERSAIVGAEPKDFRRWLWLDQLLVFKRNNIMSAESGEEKTSFKLDDIAQSILGEGKHDFDSSRTWEAWVDAGDARTSLVKYCEQDTDLLRRIEEKTGYIELFQTLAEVTGVFPDSRGLKPTSQVDAFMLRLGRQRDVHFKTKWHDSSDEHVKFRGAFVMPPTRRGIIKDVHVADFASLYPSIMLTWNLSPEVKIDEANPDVPTIYSPGTGVRTLVGQRGLICEALDELLRLRKVWNERRAQLPPGTDEAKDAERRTNAYKTAANSFYGVCGTPYSRFFDLGVSESTTQNGIWLIRHTIDAAKARGLETIYGDTDSIFVVGGDREGFREFVDWCNAELYPKLVADCGCPTNRIKLAYEKTFERVVFVTAKRYIGKFAFYKGAAARADSKPEIKGLEYKRGDTNRIARRLQGEVIMMLMKGHEDPAEFMELMVRAREHLFDGELPLHDVMMSKSISKDLDEYGRKNQAGDVIAVPPHVGLAKRMQAEGQDVSIGSRIFYVVVDASCSPMRTIAATEYQGVTDRFYLWNQLVLPPSQRLLEAAFPEHDWSTLEKKRPSKRYNPNQLELF